MDKNNSTRTITIYMPDYAEKEIYFFSVADKSLNSQSKGATFPTNYTVLDTEGRGEVDLAVPLTGEIQYRCEAPNGVIRTGYLAYASEPLALFDWMVIGVSDYLLAANNLSDLQSAAAAQLNLALLPGTYVLAFYAALDDLGLLTNTTGAADKLPYMDGDLSFALADLTAFMRSLLDDADAATARATLGAAASADIPEELTDLDTAVTGAELDADHSKLAGIESGATADQTAGEIEAIVSHDNLLDFAANEHVALPNTIANVLSDAGTMAAQDASNVSITGGTINGITDLAVADGGTGASDAATARTNLGLGSIAIQDASSVYFTGGSMLSVTLVNASIVSLSSDLAIADGGTGASTAAAARTNLGAAAADDIPDELTDLDTAVTGAQLDSIKTAVDGLGTMATESAGDYAELSTQNTFTQPNSMQISTADDGSDGWRVMKRGATGDATAAVVDNAELGYASFYGWHGSDYARGGYFLFRAIENWSGSAQGTRLEISLTDEGATTTNVPIAAEGKFVLIRDKLKFINIAATTNHVVGAISGGNTYAQDSAIADIQFVTDDSTWYYGKIVFRTANVDGTNPSYPPTERMRITAAGRVGIGASSPSAQLHVDQASSTAAIPVLTLDQADVSEEILEIISTAGTGNAVEAVGAKTLTTTEFIKITLNGNTRYIPCGTIA